MAGTKDLTTILNTAPASTYVRGPATDGGAFDIQRYFGPPLNKAAFDEYKMSPIEAMHLEQAYSGENFLLNKVVGESITRYPGGFYTQIIFPVMHIRQLRWILTLWRPNAALSARVPYEGPSRLLTSRVETLRGEVHRRADSVKLEGDFYASSPGGEIDFQMKIKQLRDTAQRTMDYLVANEINQCHDYLYTWTFQKQLLKSDPRKLIDWETSFFGFIHDAVNDMEHAAHIDQLKRSMLTYGGEEPDVALVPSCFPFLLGTKGGVPIGTKYEVINGETGAVTIKENFDAISQLGNLKIFSVPMVRADEDHEPWDPQSHTAQIGQYYVMHPRETKGAYSNYSTSGQTIFIHHEGRNQYRPVSPATAYRYCNRWDMESGMIREEHNGLVDELNAGGNLTQRWTRLGGSQDPMIRYHTGRRSWEIAHLFGQMESHFLTPAVLSCITETLMTKLDKIAKKPGGDSDQALSDLANLVRQSHAEPGTKGYLDAFATLNAQYVPTLGNVITATNAYMGFDIPDDGTTRGLGWVPPFITTYGMARTLANLRGSAKWGDAAKVAWDGCRALDLVASVIKATLPHCQLFDRKCLTYVEQHILRNASGLEALKWGLFDVMCGIPVPAFIKLDGSGRMASVSPVLRAFATSIMEKLGEKRIVTGLLYRCFDYADVTDQITPRGMENFSISGIDKPTALENAINYMTELTPDERSTFVALAEQGVFDDKTTVADLRTFTTAPEGRRAGVQFTAPFGCTIALAQRFMYDSTGGAEGGVILPPLSKDRFRVAYDGTTNLKDITALIERIVNRGQYEELWENTHHMHTAGGLLSLFSELDEGETGFAMQILETIAHMALDHQQSFGLSESRRILGTAFGLTAMDLWDTIRVMLDHDVLLPFSILVARPYITMRTHDIVIMKAGRSTGMTLLGYDGVEQGKDAGHNVWLINYHYHVAPALFRPENIAKAKDAVISHVYCGFNDEPICSDSDTPYIHQYDKIKDIMFMLGGFYDMRIDRSNDTYSKAPGLPNPVSITGNYLQLPIEPHSISEFDREFGAAAYYGKVFRETFDQTIRSISSESRFTMSSAGINSLCFLGEFYYLDPATGKFTGHVHNTGHLRGTATMPGTASARKGSAGRYPIAMVEATGLVPST